MFKEHSVFILVPIASAPISSLVVNQHPIASYVDPVALDVAMDIPLRR